MINGYLMMCLWYGAMGFLVFTMLYLLAQKWYYSATDGDKQLNIKWVDATWQPVGHGYFIPDIFAGLSWLALVIQGLFLTLAALCENPRVTIEEILMFPYHIGFLMYPVYIAGAYVVSNKLYNRFYKFSKKVEKHLERE